MLLFGTKARDVFKAWAKKDKEAQTEAVKRLGLPANNTAADRAEAMGFGDDVYHGTEADFNKFKPHKNSWSQAFFNSKDPDVAEMFGDRIMPIKTRANNIFDYENPTHIDRLLKNNMKDNTFLNNIKLDKGGWASMENDKVQKGIKELGFDGFNVREHGVKNTGLFNNTDIRSKFAHFNPRLAGVGAGSVLSADLMADESNTKPTESIWSSLMNTIGNVNQQQAQGAADIGAGAMEGTAGLAKMLVTQPDVVAETVGGGLLKAAGVVSPWIKGAGLGGVLYPSELEDGTLRDENGEYHPHVAQLKKEQQLDEYIASLTPDIHSTEIRLGR